MPSAPNSRALDVSISVSAFALISNFLCSLHQSISVLNSSDNLGASNSNSPIYISPVDPSIEIKSPSSRTFSLLEIVLVE